ncbi:MAG: aquaporin, partial [Streptococcus hyovaginalis]|nr:aquaporin [Streptococcus hyovaginalis]
MDVTWTVKYLTEFLGTAILIILGNGAVANV